jgi:hypothetical protein
MLQMNWLDFIIVILASFRITHLIVFDTIAAFIREAFLTIQEKETIDGKKEILIEPKGTGIRHFIGGLLSCYWCTGFWVSVGTVLVYFFVPILYPILIIFAVAGAAAVIESKV